MTATGVSLISSFGMRSSGGIFGNIWVLDKLKN
jgi:hypothetical protein